MKIVHVRLVALATLLTGLCAVPVFADVKTQERSLVKFEGMLGRMMGLFGGKAAKDGLVSTVAVKGDRKMTSNGDTGEIVDLAEERVYALDFDKKAYTVTTFEELRKRMQEAQRKAQENARNAKPDQESPKGDQPQMEIDVDIKDTGQRRTIIGYDTREVVMTVTVREKGKTLDENGGMVLASNMWLAPEIAALKEQLDFQRRYAQKLFGDMFSVENMQQMAAAMAMYPGMKEAIERMNKEHVNMSGTPLLTTMTFQAVQSTQEAARAERERDDADAGAGGLMGGLAKRMMKKKQDAPDEKPSAPGRATILTSTLEVQSIATAVQPADISVPAGFKQRN